jgi:very-short-patch-repair endonuclease
MTSGEPLRKDPNPRAREVGRAFFSAGRGKDPGLDLDGTGWGVFGETGWPDRAIAELAGRQRALISRRQLLALGVESTMIDRALWRGRLHRIHNGIYSLVPPKALPPLAAEQAALLACGDNALLSHRSAAAVWGICPFFIGDVELTIVANDRGRTRKGIHVHRTAHLEPRDARRHGGLPLTSPARVLIEIAPDLSPRSLERALDEALTRRLTSRTAIHAAIQAYPRSPGIARVRELADPDRPTTVTRSGGEEAFLAMARRANLPAPEVNAPLGGYTADFLWRAQKLILEIDGYQYHHTRQAFERDHRRDTAHQQQGFTIIRATGRQLSRQPESLLVLVATELARR